MPRSPREAEMYQVSFVDDEGRTTSARVPPKSLPAFLADYRDRIVEVREVAA